MRHSAYASPTLRASGLRCKVIKQCVAFDGAAVGDFAVRADPYSRRVRLEDLEMPRGALDSTSRVDIPDTGLRSPEEGPGQSDSLAARYLGSKARVLEELMRLVGTPSGTGVLVDGFCGTGVVASAAADAGWSVRVNDQMRSAVDLARARLLSTADAEFAELGGYGEVIQQLSHLSPVAGFFWREYSPASALGRRYFTEENAQRIDAVRHQLNKWTELGVINEAERSLLVADLIGAAARVANTAGTYGCYLAHWTPAAHRLFELKPRVLRSDPVYHEAFCCSVEDVAVEEGDTVYLDPPYTKRQYAAYYHINETLSHGDNPEILGKTGLRPWRDRASEYCYKARALPALTRLIKGLNARRVLLSYSSHGHVDLVDLVAALRSIGPAAVHRLGEIGRYSPNAAASDRGSTVTEFVVEVSTDPRDS